MQSHMALFFNAGQACLAGSRTFVHSSIYDRFVEASVQLAKKIKLGHSLDPNTDQGPLVSKEQMDKVLGYIASGSKEAKLLTGSGRWGEKGFHVTPTVFADVKDDHLIAREEIFGPVKILKFDDNDEVIERANKTNYGLVAGVVTENLSEANYFSRRLKAGAIFVNCYGGATPGAPFGGYKDSGIGRELGEEGLYSYLQTKTVIQNLD